MFDAIERDGLVRAGVSERQVEDEIGELAEREFGVEKHWHRRLVRAGVNTLATASDNPPVRVIAEENGKLAGALTFARIGDEIEIITLDSFVENQAAVAGDGDDGAWKLAGLDLRVQCRDDAGETRRRMWAIYGRSIAELVGARLSPDELNMVSALLGRLRHPPAGD